MSLDFLSLSLNVSSDFNSTLFDDYEYCIEAKSLSFMEFFKCSNFFFLKSIFTSFFYIFFSLSTAALNICVIFLINRHKKKKTVFDKIFIGHAFVDFLVGLIVIPTYCIYTMFGYWPLGKLACHLYVSFDYTVCHVGILHMVYLCYARLRSLISPKSFNQEFMIANSVGVMACLWILSSILWIPSTNLIVNLNFKSRECYFIFDPIFIIIQGKLVGK